jgi:hypothetical protein
MTSNDFPAYKPVLVANHQITSGRFTDCDRRVWRDVTYGRPSALPGHEAADTYIDSAGRVWIDVTAHTVALAANHWYRSAEAIIERAELRCRRTCHYRPARSDRDLRWGLPWMRRLSGPTLGGYPPVSEPPVSELLRRLAPRLHHQVPVKHGRFQGWLDGLERLGYTTRPAIKWSTPPRTAAFRPLRAATLARIEAGLRRYEERTNMPGRDYLRHVEPLRSPDLLSALMAAFDDGFKRDEN